MLTAFQGSKCVCGELKRRKYRVKARYEVRANTLIVAFCRLENGDSLGLNPGEAARDEFYSTYRLLDDKWTATP